MEILYEGKYSKISMDEGFSLLEDNPGLAATLQSLRLSSGLNFVSMYQRKSITQPSIPRLTSITPVILPRADIPDPSTRYISIMDIGKNMNDAFLGYSLANPKVSCVGEKIIFREEYSNMKNCVRVVSSCVGLWGDFVGRGMLTCMVLGTSGSPKPRVLYSAIMQLNETADRGILAIVPNNFDDKVNWGLAIARAHREGVILKSITFRDNAYHDCKKNERSCLAGIVICYKLAGAMSEEQYTLSVIVDRLNLMFFSTISCHFGETFFRVGTDLDGRGGFELESPTTEKVMKEVYCSLLDPKRKYSVGFDPGVELVVLINTYQADWNLAQTISLELMTRLNKGGYICCRVYAGNLVPSVGAGFSVTILPEGVKDVVRWLDRYTSCAGWLVAGNGNVNKYRLSVVEHIPAAKGICLNERHSTMLKTAVKLAVSNFRKEQNFFDSCDPKGEYGINMCNVCNILMKNMEENPICIQYPYILFVMIGEIFESHFKIIDGLMFALFSVTLGQYFGDHIRSPKHINEKTWERALKRSVKSVAGYYKIGYKDHTLLDIFGSFYLILTSSRLDMLTVIHLALEVSDDNCWKAKYAKPNKIIDYPFLTMKSAHMILDAVATMLRGTDINVQHLAPQDIDTTPTTTATKIKEILTSVI